MLIMPKRTSYYLSVLGAGGLFGFGLSYSEMTNPQKILGFLQVGPGWDPSMLFVMAGALLTTTLGYRLSGRRHQPLFTGHFHWPTLQVLDRSLIAGAGIFGAGWGMTGFCPGPAIVSAFLLDPRALVFLAAYLVGNAAYEQYVNRRRRLALTSS